MTQVGGAVFVKGPGRVDMRNCKFRSNRAVSLDCLDWCWRRLFNAQVLVRFFKKKI
jgi:hypothetical protein